jgi:hypothetical protein
MNSALASSPIYDEAIVGGCDVCGSAVQESVFTLPVLDGPYRNEKPRVNANFRGAWRVATYR